MSSDVAGEYFSQWGPKVTPLGMPLHVALLAQGCDSYVKTIYIGYEISGEMVAALYAHADHIAGVDQVLGVFPNIPVLAHAREHDWFQDPQLNLSLFIGEPVSVCAPTGTLAHAQKLSLGGVQFQVLETPGHSPGSVTLYCPSEKLAIVGDTLFQNSIGRSDFPGSDPDVLMHSINEVLMTLPGDTAIYPGHGPSTTIDKERRNNPFLR